VEDAARGWEPAEEHRQVDEREHYHDTRGQQASALEEEEYLAMLHTLPVSLATALPRPSQHIPRKRGNAPGIFPRQIGRVSPSRWETSSDILEAGTANVCLLKVIHSESEELPCRFHRIQAA
jgi:hypothetical protein